MRCLVSRHVSFAVCFVLAIAAPPACGADDVRQAFDSLFAAKIKAAASTIDRADDLALARDILAVAKSTTNQPALLALLCDAAHDLAIKHADGYSTGVEAQQILADTVAEKRPGARDKLVALLTRQAAAGKPDEREPAGEKLIELLIAMGDEKAEKKQYSEAAGDYRRAVSVATQRKSALLEEAKAKLEWATGRERTTKRLAQLQEKLLKDAADHAAAEEIVKLYVVELDDPASASPFLNRVKDEQQRKMVPLAMEPIEKLTEAQCLTLGEWFRSQAVRSTGAPARAPLERADKLLSRFLASSAGSPLERTKAEVALKELRAELAKGSAPVATTRPTKPKIPVSVDGWNVRCWQNRWINFPLSKVDAKATEDGLVVKNTTGIHSFVQLYYGNAIDGDFEFEVQVMGAKDVGIVTTDGADRTFQVIWEDRTQWRTVRIVRKKENLRWFVDGKPTEATSFDTNDKTMKCHIHVGLWSNETLTIRQVKLTKPK